VPYEYESAAFRAYPELSMESSAPPGEGHPLPIAWLCKRSVACRPITHGGAFMEVRFRFEWADEHYLTIDQSDPQEIDVVAHPGLSEVQIDQACRELDGYGQAVKAAWRAAVARGTMPSAT